MQLNDLEEEDEDFRNFLKEVSAEFLRLFIKIEWFSRLHSRKSQKRLNQKAMVMNEWRLNPNQVRCNVHSS